MPHFAFFGHGYLAVAPPLIDPAPLIFLHLRSLHDSHQTRLPTLAPYFSFSLLRLEGFLDIDLEAGFAEPAKNELDMARVFLLRLTKDLDIVDIGGIKVVEVHVEKVINVFLEGREGAI